MEELQDAIEDAQYVNAISTQEDGPRPVLPWEIPTEEQLAEWETVCKGKEDATSGRFGTPLSYEWYLSSAVGFFLFSAYLKEGKEDYVRVNFVEEVLRFRKLRGRQRLEKGRFINAQYLQTPKQHLETGKPELPDKTEIDEYDLDRKPADVKMTDQEFQAICNQSIDSENLFCCIGLKGPVRDELITSLQSALDQAEAIQKAESVPTLIDGTTKGEEAKEAVVSPGGSEPLQAPVTPSKESMKDLTKRMRAADGVGDMPGDIFDKAEAVIMEALRRDSWESFQESEWYTKLRNFMWYQDRRVVPEDFFVMRVLGRGGFGLVTGKSAARSALKIVAVARVAALRHPGCPL